ncbi:hypothetical protein IU485_27900 [Nocardia cyriacigeorgica]|uniref:hypothetical protein n=1 Tax=Nocardia cyriacigeorgica TaxID=135487 RepID=UPI00189345E3|nr:hypothetical protein [Nocardia cyriacigeorgica]MBF6085202.1 hypothetical protein [Nocardia cyriacigeorgica]
MHEVMSNRSRKVMASRRDSTGVLRKGTRNKHDAQSVDMWARGDSCRKCGGTFTPQKVWSGDKFGWVSGRVPAHGDASVCVACHHQTVQQKEEPRKPAPAPRAVSDSERVAGYVERMRRISPQHWARFLEDIPARYRSAVVRAAHVSS